MKNSKKLNDKKSLPIKIMRGIFVVYVIMTFILAFVGFRSKTIDMAFDSENIMLWDDGWRIYTNGKKMSKTVIPVKLEGVTSETVEIRNTLPDDLAGMNCLLIESKRQDTAVYINHYLRKSISSRELRQGRSLPNEYLMVPLDSEDRGKSIIITYRTNSVYSGNIGEVYIGDQISILMMLLQKNIAWLLLVAVLIALGLMCFAFRVIYRNSFERSEIFAYLAAFCICTSIYCFNQLRIKQCFVKDLPMLEVFAYTSFLLVPFTILMIVYGVTYYRHRNIIIVLSAISLINFISQQLCHNLLNADYFSMQSITQLFILIILALMIILFIRDKDASKRKASLFVVIACGFVLLGIVLEAILISLGTEMPGGSIFLIGSLMFALSVLTYCFDSISKENEGKKKAELANQAKSAFLAGMSHEIRTPINAIVGINEIISRETHEECTRKYAANIAEASNSLLYLVNDILDYSKIESGKMDIVEVEYDVKQFLEEMTILVEARLHGKNLDFRFDIDQEMPCTLYGDIARIKQVCINLLTNAIKYTEKGGFTFTIKCQEIKDDKARIFVSVKDTGIGIKEEDRDRIIGTEFVRLDSKKNYNIEGTGLGLAISTRLLTLMNSELKLDSVYGEGSDFYFTIDQKVVDSTPIKNVKSVKNNKVKEIGFTCPDARILVVDDTKTNIIVMKGLLKQFGNKAFTCDSGEKCIEECGANQYDIIFLDIMMPGINGVETLEKLKADNLIGDTPVVALTANATSGAREMYISQGFSEYMSKPFQMSELEEMLHKLLKQELIIEK